MPQLLMRFVTAIWLTLNFANAQEITEPRSDGDHGRIAKLTQEVESLTKQVHELQSKNQQTQPTSGWPASQQYSSQRGSNGDKGGWPWFLLGILAVFTFGNSALIAYHFLVVKPSATTDADKRAQKVMEQILRENKLL